MTYLSLFLEHRRQLNRTYALIPPNVLWATVTMINDRKAWEGYPRRFGYINHDSAGRNGLTYVKGFSFLGQEHWHTCQMWLGPEGSLDSARMDSTTILILTNRWNLEAHEWWHYNRSTRVQAKTAFSSSTKPTPAMPNHKTHASLPPPSPAAWELLQLMSVRAMTLPFGWARGRHIAVPKNAYKIYLLLLLFEQGNCSFLMAVLSFQASL